MRMLSPYSGAVAMNYSIFIAEKDGLPVAATE
jgi:hypothetical protein